MAADRSMQAAVTIARFVVENRRLRSKIEAATSKRRGLEDEICSKDEALDSLSDRFVEKETNLREICTRKEICLAEKAGLEKDYEFLDRESTAVITAMVAATADLEERLKRKTRDLRVFSEKVMKMLKGIEEKASGESSWEDGWEIMEDLTISQAMEVDADGVDEGRERMMKPFVKRVQKIEDALKIRK